MVIWQPCEWQDGRETEWEMTIDNIEWIQSPFVISFGYVLGHDEQRYSVMELDAYTEMYAVIEDFYTLDSAKQYAENKRIANCQASHPWQEKCPHCY
jgi:hypothetical protein